MAIIPRGGFRTKTNPSNSRITLPDDGRAAPYKALASLSTNLSGVAGKMWESSEKDRRSQEVSKLVEENALRSAKLHEASNTMMKNRKDGNVDDDTAYSQNIASGEDEIESNLADTASDTEVRNLFLARTAGVKKNRKVKSLTTELTYRTGMYKDSNRIAASQEAGGVAALEGTALDEGLSLFNKRQLKYQEDAITGISNDLTQTELTRHAGNTMAETLLDNVVSRGDFPEFNRLVGSNFFATDAGKKLLEEFPEEGITIREFLEAKKIETDDSDKFEQLRGLIPPQKINSAYRQLLSRMKDKSNINMSELNQQFKDLRALSSDTTGRVSTTQLNSMVDKLTDDMLKANIAPNIVASKRTELLAASTLSTFGNQIAMLKPSTKAAAVAGFGPKLISDIEDIVNKDERFRGRLTPANISEITKVAVNSAASTHLKQEDEKRDNSAAYIFKHDRGTARDFQKAFTSGKAGAGRSATRAIRRKALEIGVRPRNIQLIPPAIQKDIAFDISSKFAKDDGAVDITNTIAALKNSFGEDYSAIMNDMIESELLEGSHEALSMVSWIPDTKLMRNSILDLKGLADNRKTYDRQNNVDGKEVFNVDSAAASLTSKKVGFYISSSGNNANLTTKRRFNQYMDLVTARFYSLKSALTPSSEDADVYERASKQVTDALNFEVEFNGNKALLPKYYKVTVPKAKAAMKVLMRQGSEAELDIDKYEANVQKLEGTTREDKQRILNKRMRDNMVVISPPANGGSKGEGLELGIKSVRGVIPFRELTGQGNSFVPRIPYSEMDSNIDVQIQENDDSKSIFDRLNDNEANRLFGE